jgi:hypothetical protein
MQITFRAIRRCITCAVLGSATLLPAPLVAKGPLTLLATIDHRGATGESPILPADVHITEDGRPAAVLSVAPVRRVPKVQILIDNGIGVGAASVADLRRAVEGLLDALPSSLEVTLVTTAPQPRFLERATTDRARVRDAVNRLTLDSSAGRFVESLYEAVDRIEKDKDTDAAYTIFTLGTTSGDRDVRDGDVQKIMQRVRARGTVVHAVILAKSAANGGNQLDLAHDVTRVSGGRLDVINAPSRLVTLLQEHGAHIATACDPEATQVRVVFERPTGMSGELGRVQVGVRGKVLTALALVEPPGGR